MIRGMRNPTPGFSVKIALSVEPKYLGNLKHEANLDTFLVLLLCPKPSLSSWDFWACPLLLSLLPVQLDPLYGKISITTQPEAGDYPRPHPSSEEYGQQFPEDRCCLCCPGDPMKGTEWDTVGRREEERDHLENGYLLMQDTWQFVQCLVSPVLAKFCSP